MSHLSYWLIGFLLLVLIPIPFQVAMRRELRRAGLHDDLTFVGERPASPLSV